MDERDEVAAFRPRRWVPWVASAIVTFALGVLLGFVALLIGSDEALAARPWLWAAGGAIVGSVVLFGIGIARWDAP